jgi:hypothetical protein
MAPARGHRLDWASLAAALPAVLARRSRNVHKGTFGTLGIVGGAEGMIGAPLLAGRAALHAGAGKVLIGFAADPHPAIDWGQPELMLRGASEVLESTPDALVCGPGLGTQLASKTLVAGAIASPAPLVLDADALNIIAADSTMFDAVAARRAPTLATPHPAEAARLLGATAADVQKDSGHHTTIAAAQRGRRQGPRKRATSGWVVGHQRDRQSGLQRRHRRRARGLRGRDAAAHRSASRCESLSTPGAAMMPVAGRPGHSVCRRRARWPATAQLTLKDNGRGQGSDRRARRRPR